MEIRGEDYVVWFDSSSTTISFKGSLRLSSMEEYAPIVQLLGDVVDQEPPTVVLDLRNLEFLNSSGINVLSKFVIKVRQKGNVHILVHGSRDTPWQLKSLKNLQRLMPSLTLQFD
ncbi:MAG: hypothetical protein NZ772_04945 [Cyanobacteria bacterium]|nr:hypothetical protein [Cyanobacteriota bacterium]MDW8200799.1 hypothetical protein [Cyanobacteriota bacterium SKYGB_h_bin112]